MTIIPGSHPHHAFDLFNNFYLQLSVDFRYSRTHILVVFDGNFELSFLDYVPALISRLLTISAGTGTFVSHTHFQSIMRMMR